MEPCKKHDYKYQYKDYFPFDAKCMMKCCVCGQIGLPTRDDLEDGLSQNDYLFHVNNCNVGDHHPGCVFHEASLQK